MWATVRVLMSETTSHGLYALSFTLSDPQSEGGVAFGIGDAHVENEKCIGSCAHGWGIHAHNCRMSNNGMVVVHQKRVNVCGGDRVDLTYDPQAHKLTLRVSERGIALVYSNESFPVPAYFFFTCYSTSQAVRLLLD